MRPFGAHLLHALIKVNKPAKKEALCRKRLLLDEAMSLLNHIVEIFDAPEFAVGGGGFLPIRKLRLYYPLRHKTYPGVKVRSVMCDSGNRLTCLVLTLTRG
jgi:hypothetical protein